MDNTSSIVLTQDNSPTLYSNVHRAHYHSIFGAMQESMHIFIQHGLYDAMQQFHSSINILEVGFGSGLNTLLTLIESKKLNVKINYTGVEKHIISEAVVQELIQHNPFKLYLEETKLIHQNIFSTPYVIAENFYLTKINDDIYNTLNYLNKTHFNIIYYDAFAPSSQPEMWDSIIFKHLFDRLVQKGFLITYCAKGQFKRDLKSIGFKVVSCPGPIGKREITKAIKE